MSRLKYIINKIIEKKYFYNIKTNLKILIYWPINKLKKKIINLFIDKLIYFTEKILSK